MPRIEYVGFRRPGEAGPAQVWIDTVADDGHIIERKPLPLYRGEVNHSPDGFQWGYGGSGAAQLAYALARHATGDKLRAQCIYQQLKWALVAPMHEDVFRFRQDSLQVLIGKLEAIDWAKRMKAE